MPNPLLHSLQEYFSFPWPHNNQPPQSAQTPGGLPWSQNPAGRHSLQLYHVFSCSQLYVFWYQFLPSCGLWRSVLGITGVMHLQAWYVLMWLNFFFYLRISYALHTPQPPDTRHIGGLYPPPVGSVHPDLYMPSVGLHHQVFDHPPPFVRPLCMLFAMLDTDNAAGGREEMS